MKIVNVMGVDLEVVIVECDCESVKEYCESLRLVDCEIDEDDENGYWDIEMNENGWMKYGYEYGEFFGWCKVYCEGDEGLKEMGMDEKESVIGILD
jgi:hypothetical protein